MRTRRCHISRRTLLVCHWCVFTTTSRHPSTGAELSGDASLPGPLPSPSPARKQIPAARTWDVPCDTRFHSGCLAPALCPRSFLCRAAPRMDHPTAQHPLAQNGVDSQILMTPWTHVDGCAWRRCTVGYFWSCCADAVAVP
ncbi:hypothetical protein EXIGLDRAFT_99031 [Exidia glandulosa HHB12029]|uniref:Secreted protein n=1 Tax=Exidia glandulosa HHB12029 TaxID=1314781 RepID=A0A165NPP6_EXIGL|nr:hypothetical protein EXIGLDRAFT_99031 [Exidia glandulosa HHB12029]